MFSFSFDKSKSKKSKKSKIRKLKAKQHYDQINFCTKFVPMVKNMMDRWVHEMQFCQHK